MIGKLIAGHDAIGGEVPHTGTADQIGATWSAGVVLTFRVCPGGTNFDDLRDLVRYKFVAADP